MRKPTSPDEQLAWWRNAVATGDGSVAGDEPRCGWFKAREKARSKTWLPARVWLNQPVDWTTGDLLGPETFVLQIAERTWTEEMEVAERWLRLRPIAVQEWEWLTARLALHRSFHGTAPPTYTFG